jgi:hypothetical protein
VFFTVSTVMQSTISRALKCSMRRWCDALLSDLCFRNHRLTVSESTARASLERVRKARMNMTVGQLCRSPLCLLLTASFALSFTHPRHFCATRTTSALDATRLVVISPPGGIGEVAAVNAASTGCNVRWFVISPLDTPVGLSPQVLAEISNSGSLDLAGSDVKSLLLSPDDPASSVQAVATWCGNADAIVCTMDGIDATEAKPNDGEDPKVLFQNAIKVAAREAAKQVSGYKVAVLSAFDEELDAASEENNGGFGRLVGNIFSSSQATNIPESLTAALGKNVLKLRHGQLFGLPESSPDFSPLVGGPRRVPEFCEEYTTRSVRIDSTLSMSGNTMVGKTTRTSRHAVGQAAVLMATGSVQVAADMDVCVSSLRGTEIMDIETWEKEFDRVQEKILLGQDAQLFTAEYDRVPDTGRLADWLATKWAPAVLRTYDIATIRSGARPVYATKADESTVEIVWQQLKEYESVTVGKMSIQVSDNGLVAVRKPGDASKGFGSISSKPLNGEDVLVRLLSEASLQAIEKGLATKVSWTLVPLGLSIFSDC